MGGSTATLETTPTTPRNPPTVDILWISCGKLAHFDNPRNVHHEIGLDMPGGLHATTHRMPWRALYVRIRPCIQMAYMLPVYPSRLLAMIYTHPSMCRHGLAPMASTRPDHIATRGGGLVLSSSAVRVRPPRRGWSMVVVDGVASAAWWCGRSSSGVAWGGSGGGRSSGVVRPVPRGGGWSGVMLSTAVPLWITCGKPVDNPVENLWIACGYPVDGGWMGPHHGHRYGPGG